MNMIVPVAIIITADTVSSKRMKRPSVSSSRASPLCLLTIIMASANYKQVFLVPGNHEY